MHPQDAGMRLGSESVRVLNLKSAPRPGLSIVACLPISVETHLLRPPLHYGRRQGGSRGHGHHQQSPLPPKPEIAANSKVVKLMNLDVDGRPVIFEVIGPR